ncbi:MAG TPA: sigma-70 family RNA polymerase sigma factor [Streptosporangiaceae bacterium]
MKAPLLVDALRTRDPGAPAALYDTHGESLFRYCWFILRNRDAAQVALRDTLVLAEAHISELRDPEMLRPWLYALARGECLRRQQAPGAAHDAVVARPDQPDADRRLIAWHAVLSLDPAESEALELTLRHGMDTALTALVMDLPTDEVQRVLERARVHLEQALAGEILARHGVHNCPERVAALQGWAGEQTVALRERLVQHAMACQVCGRYLPRNVSATKVYSLLPVPVPPQAMRLRVMTCFADPELVGYRMFVAARVTGFGTAGFPGEETGQEPPSRGATVRAWSGPAAAAVAVAVLVAAVFTIGKLSGLSTPVQGVSSAAGGGTVFASPTVSLPVPGTGPAGPPGHRARHTSATLPAESVSTGKGSSPTPLFLRASSGPVPYQKPGPSTEPSSQSPSPGGTGTGTGTGTPTPPAGRLQDSPADLALGTGSTGQITLSASGGPVGWTASSSSADISLSSSGGHLAAGQQTVVTVTVNRTQQPSGQGTVTFTPGGGAVTVSWSSPASSPPPPPPSSSPTPTVVPPSPTPTSPSRLPTPSTPPTNSSAPVPPPTPAPAPTQTPTQPSSPPPPPPPSSSPAPTATPTAATPDVTSPADR